MSVNETIGDGGEATAYRRTNDAAIAPRLVGEVRRADEAIVALVQARPLATLCAVAAVGYLIGRMLSRWD